MKTLLTAALTFTACAALRRRIEDRGQRDLGPVQIRPLKNRGAAFDLPIPARAIPVLSGVALGLALCLRREHPAAVGLLLGGGLSNLWERVVLGGVLDYLRFPKGPWRVKKYVYNLADFAVFAGALGLLRR